MTIARIGEPSTNDVDLVFLGHTESPESECSAIETFLTAFGGFTRSIDMDIVTRNEHRHLLQIRGPVLHVLYYPSLTHMIAWEPPALIASAFSTASIIQGSLAQLGPYSAGFRSGDSTLFAVPFPFYLAYDAVALSSLLYLKSGSKHYPPNAYVRNALYVLRYVIRDLMLRDCRPEDPVSFWSWEGLIAHMRKSTPPYEALSSLFSNRNQLSMSDPVAIERLYYLYLRLSRSGLSALASTDGLVKELDLE